MIREKFIRKEFTNKDLSQQILIQCLMHNKEKYDLAMSKSANILSKLVANQPQLIMKNKISEKAWNALQERFWHINLINTSYLIYEATTKKLLDFKDIHKFTNSY